MLPSLSHSGRRLHSLLKWVDLVSEGCRRWHFLPFWPQPREPSLSKPPFRQERTCRHIPTDVRYGVMLSKWQAQTGITNLDKSPTHSQVKWDKQALAQGDGFGA